ncbi:hypothetical protein ABG768_020276, partial [Culter alburnus]
MQPLNVTDVQTASWTNVSQLCEQKRCQVSVKKQKRVQMHSGIVFVQYSVVQCKIL